MNYFCLVSKKKEDLELFPSIQVSNPNNNPPILSQKVYYY